MANKAVFLDRDGTLIKEKEYLSDPQGVELIPGVVAGIRKLRQAGFLAVVTSNQSGVARGYFTLRDVEAVNARMRSLLQAESADLDAIYYCPHYEQGTVQPFARACDCRKPLAGMLHQAVREWDVDLAASWVVGDKAADITFGRNHGLATVLVLTGYGLTTWQNGFPPGQEPDAVANDLGEAADFILNQRPGPLVPPPNSLRE